MATVNFSVPDEVKASFDKAFSDQNKSAIVAELMRRAVRESVQRQRRERLFRQLTRARSRRQPASGEAMRAARTTGRP
jgi:Arc/MetJ family transcription regulator